MKPWVKRSFEDGKMHIILQGDSPPMFHDLLSQPVLEFSPLTVVKGSVFVVTSSMVYAALASWWFMQVAVEQGSAMKMGLNCGARSTLQPFSLIMIYTSSWLLQSTGIGWNRQQELPALCCVTPFCLKKLGQCVEPCNLFLLGGEVNYEIAWGLFVFDGSLSIICYYVQSLIVLMTIRRRFPCWWLQACKCFHQKYIQSFMFSQDDCCTSFSEYVFFFPSSLVWSQFPRWISNYTDCWDQVFCLRHTNWNGVHPQQPGDLVNEPETSAHVCCELPEHFHCFE